MATRPVKKSATSSSATSTPQVPSSSSQASSPMTPTRMSRMQEKHQLASLNDRLAAYIERNQHLENENVRITRQLSQHDEHTQKTIARINKTFDKELLEARRLVDETAKDKAKLVFEHEKLKNDHTDARIKLDKITKDFKEKSKLLSSVQSQLDTISRDAAAAASERDKLAEDKKDLENDVARLSADVEKMRKQLENETMKRIEAENKLKSKIEEMNYRAQQQEETIEEMRTRRSIEIQEVGGQIQEEYETKFQQSIQELREEYENQIRANKEEMESLYEQKVGDLKNQLKRYQSSANSKADEISELSTRVKSLTENFHQLETERNELSDRIKQMEKQMADEHARFVKIIQDRDADIDQMIREKNALLNEYQDLMDMKVGLDNEIAMYRKLLEGEEKRLSISPRHVSGFDPTETPSRRTPLRSGLKRKRGGAIEDFASDEATTYETHAEAHGDIEILEDDPEGKFVKIHNKGDKEVSLSGWQLIRKAGDGETIHKFHRSVKLERNGVTTVYSADVQDVAHEPPATIIMKGQKWFGGDVIKTLLLNTAGEEMAKRETHRVQVAYSRRRMGVGTLGSTAEDLFHQEGDGAQGDRCVIC